MHLVDRHRGAVGVAAGPLRHPNPVAPLESVRLPDPRGRLRPDLHGERQWIGLEPNRAVGAEHLELVQLAFGYFGHEQLPDAGAAQTAHRQQATVPAAEVADHADAACVWRPDSEGHPGRPIDGHRVSAEHVVQALVGAFADQVKVQLADGRTEPIRVVAFPRCAVGQREAQPIGERWLDAGQQGRPHAIADSAHR